MNEIIQFISNLIILSFSIFVLWRVHKINKTLDSFDGSISEAEQRKVNKDS